MLWYSSLPENHVYLKGPCNVFFIIATERLHVQKDILQIRLIIFTDKYEKKNKKSVLQTAPPPWRNLIYINILHNCDVRFRSCREPSASHSTFAHCSAAHSHIHQYDQLAEVLWIHYFAKCQPGVLLQAPDYNMLVLKSTSRTAPSIFVDWRGGGI